MALLSVLCSCGPSAALARQYNGFEGTIQARAAQLGAETRVKAAERTIKTNEDLLRTTEHSYWTLSIQGADHTLTDLSITEVRSKLSLLGTERILALAEIKAGLFCSGCGRTKSEILRLGQTFPHPGMHILNLTGGELDARIKAKEAEYAGKETALQRQLDLLLARRQTEENAWQQKLAALRETIKQATAALNTARDERHKAALELIRAESAITMLALYDKWDAEGRKAVEDRRKSEERKMREDDLTQAEAKVPEQESLVDRAGFKARLHELEAEEARERNDPVAEKKANDERDRALTEQKAANRLLQSSEKEATLLQRDNLLNAVGAPLEKTDVVLPKGTKRIDFQLPEELDGMRVAGKELVHRELERLYHDRGDLARDVIDRLVTDYGPEASNRFQIVKDGDDLLRNYAKWKEEGTLAEHLREKGLKYTDDLVSEKLNYGPNTFRDQLSSNYEEAIDGLLKRDKESESWGFLQLGNALVDKAKDYAVEKTEGTFLDFMHEIIYGKESRLTLSAGNSRVDDAASEFEQSVSAPTLIYDTFPFTGGRSVLGLKRYLNRAKDDFFKYFDLSTSQLEENTEP